MAGWFIQPFFEYSGATAWLYPEVGRENYRAPKQVERYDHISANGSKLSYNVGSREFIDVTFPWQSDAKLVEWITFWDAVSDGSEFVYGNDDSLPQCGGGEVSGTPVTGTPASGGTYSPVTVTLEDTEFNPEPAEIDGYWTVTVRMRKVV